MTVRDFIHTLSKPENRHLLDCDLGIETERDYDEALYIYVSTLAASDGDKDEQATSVSLSTYPLHEVDDESTGTGLFRLTRHKLS